MKKCMISKRIIDTIYGLKNVAKMLACLHLLVTCCLMKAVTVLQKFLKPPAPPQIRTASSYEKTSGKVLTSVEHRKCLEEG